MMKKRYLSSHNKKLQNLILQITKSYFTKSIFMGVNRANEQKAIALMKSNIHSTWVNTDMGSGCRLVLKDTFGSVIHERTYLDIFELPEDIENPTEAEKQEYYQEWKENLEADSFNQFVGLCEVKWLYFFL